MVSAPPHLCVVPLQKKNKTKIITSIPSKTYYPSEVGIYMDKA